MIPGFTAQFRVLLDNCDNGSNDGTRIYTVVAGVTVTVPIPRDRCSLDIRHNPTSSDCQATNDPDSGSNRTLERFVRANRNNPISAQGAPVDQGHLQCLLRHLF